MTPEQIRNGISVHTPDMLFINDADQLNLMHGFMGTKYRSYSSTIRWNEIMPILRRVEETKGNTFFTTISIQDGLNIGIYAKDNQSGASIHGTHCFLIDNVKEKLEALWICIIYFIEWYNEYKPTDEAAAPMEARFGK